MYYVWIENFERDGAMTLYPQLQRAIDFAVLMEMDGYSVQVRDAATGELVYE